MIKQNESLNDIWRTQHPDEKKFTCTKTNARAHRTSLSRIDYFLVSEELCTAVPSTDISPGFLSDHAIPILHLRPVGITKGPGFLEV